MLPQPLTHEEIVQKRVGQRAIMLRLRSLYVISHICFFITAVSLLMLFCFSIGAIADKSTTGVVAPGLFHALLLSAFFSVSGIPLSNYFFRKYYALKSDVNSDPLAYLSIQDDIDKCGDVAKWIKNYEEINEFAQKLSALKRFPIHAEYLSMKALVAEKENPARFLAEVFCTN